MSLLSIDVGMMERGWLVLEMKGEKETHAYFKVFLSENTRKFRVIDSKIKDSNAKH